MTFRGFSFSGLLLDSRAVNPGDEQKVLAAAVVRAESVLSEACGGRVTCYRCFRPGALCYCDLIPRVRSNRRIVIVQHEREEFHPLNTTRMIELALEGASVLRGSTRELEARLAENPLPDDAALLFPSPESLDLHEAEALQPISTIVAVDGTWDQAKTLLRLEGLSRLRHVRFTPKAPSEYRIRKEPKLDYLSTLESVAFVLEQLEPETDVEALRALFRAVIDRNIEARPEFSDLAQQRKRVRGRGLERPFPFPELVSDGASRTFVYAESAAIETREGVHHEPLIVGVLRGGAPEPECLVLRTSRAPRERLLEHLGLTRSEVERGATTAEALAWLSERLGNSRVLAWSTGSGRILAELGWAGEVESLKGPYCDYRRYRDKRAGRTTTERFGSLGEILGREELGAITEPARVKRRLLELARLYRWLCRQAATHS